MKYVIDLPEGTERVHIISMSNSGDKSIISDQSMSVKMLEYYTEPEPDREQIRVGDEVEYECDGIVRFVVFGIVGNTAYGFKYPCDYDDVGDYCDIDMLKKTGRHFDELEELLKKMRGVE